MPDFDTGSVAAIEAFGVFARSLNGLLFSRDGNLALRVRIRRLEASHSVGWYSSAAQVCALFRIGCVPEFRAPEWPYEDRPIKATVKVDDPPHSQAPSAWRSHFG
ncbi:hypothetical protein XH80_35040 [Bradyrhizobium sp. CCBAU 45384]|nr:hypothetical protein [Bradyrhizobium sp. CCBAU 45384]